jgi:hypothetical protein
MQIEMLDAFGQVARSNAHVLVIRGEAADFHLGGYVCDRLGISAAKLRLWVEMSSRALDRLDQLPIAAIASVQGGGCAFVPKVGDP